MSSLTTQLKKRTVLYRLQGGKCFLCDNSFSEEQVFITLLLPKSLGGTRLGQNCVVACKPCSSKRGTETTLPTQEQLARVKEIYQHVPQSLQAEPTKQVGSKDVKKLRKSLAWYEQVKAASREARKQYREQKKRSVAPWSCARKIKHTSYSSALAHLLHLNKTGLVVYKCLVCSGYHVGHKRGG